jgi:hypothetical protein
MVYISHLCVDVSDKCGHIPLYGVIPSVDGCRHHTETISAHAASVKHLRAIV